MHPAIIFLVAAIFCYLMALILSSIDGKGVKLFVVMTITTSLWSMYYSVLEGLKQLS
jgi:hypothetical protein